MVDVFLASAAPLARDSGRGSKVALAGGDKALDRLAPGMIASQPCRGLPMKSRQRRFAAFGLTAVVMAGVAAAVGYLGSARLSAAQPTLQLVNLGT
jgi:hypothetical protein